MSVGIAGLGWVTPLGTDLQEVWAQVSAGVRPEVKSLTNPETGRALPFIPTPPAAVAHLSRNPRLRRSSTISMLAVAAVALMATPALAHSSCECPQSRNVRCTGKSSSWAHAART